MDSNLTPPPVTPTDPTQKPTLGENIKDASNEFVKNNYESFLRRLVNLIFSLINWVKFGVTQIIKQLLNKN